MFAQLFKQCQVDNAKLILISNANGNFGCALSKITSNESVVKY